MQRPGRATKQSPEPREAKMQKMLVVLSLWHSCLQCSNLDRSCGGGTCLTCAELPLCMARGRKKVMLSPGGRREREGKDTNYSSARDASSKAAAVLSRRLTTE